MKKRGAFRQGGFTLVEALITSALIALTGAVVISIIYSGLVLFSKNTAINIAHQQGRSVFMGMVRDIHGAVSIPQLVDANRNGVSGTGSAAGISFQLFAAGPFKIHNNKNVSAGDSNIQVYTGKTFTPQAGQRLIIPGYQVEVDVDPRTPQSNGNVATVFVAQPIGVDIVISKGGNNYNVPCFFTERVSYVVVNGQLRYYGRAGSNAYRVLGYGITSATPFSIPTSSGGTPNNRFVSAIDLTAADTRVSNRGYRSVNLFLNSTLSPRAKLTTYQ
jgi:hypothetical protein